MNLTNMVKNVKKFNADNTHSNDSCKIVVEFNNGFGIAYEKTHNTIDEEIFNENNIAIGTAQKKVLRINYRELEPTINEICGAKSLSGNSREPLYFSPEFEELLSTPQTTAQKHAQELESKIEQCYDAITKPLQIEQYAFRDWKNILGTTGIMLGLTALWPLTITYILSGRMMKHDASGDAALALALAPLRLPFVLASAVKEIITPTTTANRINNTKLLSKNQKNNDAYLYFPYNDEGTPSRYTNLDIVVNGNTHLSKSTKTTTQILGNGTSSYPANSNQNMIYARKEREDMYHGKRFFFKIDEKLSTEISNTVDEKEKLQEEYRQFYTRVTQKNQINLLKNIGFI